MALPKWSAFPRRANVTSRSQQDPMDQVIVQRNEEIQMLKKIGFATVGAVAGMIMMSGVASAEDEVDVPGLINLEGISVLNNLNLNAGICNNTVSVLGVLVGIENVLNGLNLPELPEVPGDETRGEPVSNCASTNGEG